MKTLIISRIFDHLLRFFFIIAVGFSFLMLLNCSNDDKDDGNSVIDQYRKDAFSFEGPYPNVVKIPVSIEGEEYIVNGYEGLITVYFNDNAKHEDASRIIEKNNGKIIAQIPYINYYLIQVESGEENNFLQDIKSENILYAFVNPPYYPNIAGIIDSYHPYADGYNHGKNVAGFFAGCVGDASYQIGYLDIGSPNTDGSVFLEDGYNHISDILQGSYYDYYANGYLAYKPDSPLLINMSYGPKIYDNSGNMSNWVNVTDANLRKAYIAEFQNFIKNTVIRISKTKNRKDIVVTVAAGNDLLPDFYKQIIEPMFLDNYKGIKLDNNTQKNILNNNIVFITAKDDRGDPYSNESSKHHTVAKVDISNIGIPDNGTSFAAPKALCDIYHLMQLKNNKDKSLTAVQALAIIKEAVANNQDGLLILDDAIKIAKDKLGIKDTTDSIVDTKWHWRETDQDNYTDIKLYFKQNNVFEFVFDNDEITSKTFKGEWTKKDNNTYNASAKTPDGTWNFVCKVVNETTMNVAIEIGGDTENLVFKKM